MTWNQEPSDLLPALCWSAAAISLCSNQVGERSWDPGHKVVHLRFFEKLYWSLSLRHVQIFKISGPVCVCVCVSGVGMGINSRILSNDKILMKLQIQRFRKVGPKMEFEFSLLVVFPTISWAWLLLGRVWWQKPRRRGWEGKFEIMITKKCQKGGKPSQKFFLFFSF